MEGSTVLCSLNDAVATGEMTQGKVLSLRRCAGELEAKMLAVGRRISIPRA